MNSHNRRRQINMAHRFYGRTHDRIRENGLAVETKRVTEAPQPKVQGGSGAAFARMVPLRVKA